MNTFLSKHLLVFGAGLLCIATANPVAAADNGGRTNSPWLMVGDKVPDLKAFPTFTVVDGKLQPVTQVKNDRHYLVVFCEIKGEDLAFDLFEFAEQIETWKRPGIQTCVIFSATLDDVSRVMARRIPLTKKTYAQLFSGALLVAADLETVRKTTQLGVRNSLPRFGDQSRLGVAADEAEVQAILFSKEGIIEWMGDITWADRPIDQLIAGDWDRTVTEMALRLSESLFFDMMFFADVGDPESKAQFQPQDATVKWNGSAVRRIRSKDGRFEINYAKPLLRCVEAEAKGKRDTALRLLAESTLAVNCRLLTFDQYWSKRSAVSFLAGLRTTLATNAMLTAELKDSETIAKLQAQRQSLARWVAILQMADEGNLKKIDALIAALPKDEVQDNEFGILRCRIDACLASSLPGTVPALQQVLQFKETVRCFDGVVDSSETRFNGYITESIFERLLDKKPVPDGIQPFLRQLQNRSDSNQNQREVDILHIPDD